MTPLQIEFLCSCCLLLLLLLLLLAAAAAAAAAAACCCCCCSTFSTAGSCALLEVVRAIEVHDKDA